MSLQTFNKKQIEIVNNAAFTAEELVSDAYKISANQWLRGKYDIKTLADLSAEEIVDGPFAQIIRYQGKPYNSDLSSASYDFYKICLQDHSILSILKERTDIKLFPFVLYSITHELIHIVRFIMFLQNFEASEQERMAEEIRVHKKTREILKDVKLAELTNVFEFYNKWLDLI